MVFEVFKASPSASEVLAAGNAVQWDFPGRTIEIPSAKFREISFFSCGTLDERMHYP